MVCNSNRQASRPFPGIRQAICIRIPVGGTSDDGNPWPSVLEHVGVARSVTREVPARGADQPLFHRSSHGTTGSYAFQGLLNRSKGIRRQRWCHDGHAAIEGLDNGISVVCQHSHASSIVSGVTIVPTKESNGPIHKVFGQPVATGQPTSAQGRGWPSHR